MDQKLQSEQRFAVSILKDDQEDLSRHFARQKKLNHVPFERLDGLPVIQNALAQFTCRVYDRHPAGDHFLYIGEIEQIAVNAGLTLIYFNSRYHNN
ncbi:flavin reductase family protein [Terrilactibacillus sp. S3-3]|nr:flavin reductase family protein [Terrilactibacillus sp. S3-3]